MKTLFIFVLFFFVFFPNTFFAQNFEDEIITYGDFNPTDIHLPSMDSFPEATAVVLMDQCWIYPDFDGMEIVHYVRIQILEEGGKSYGDISIPYYSKGGTQILTAIKAKVHFKENGKVQQLELPKNKFFKEELSSEVSVMKFYFPKVSPGNILEYTYTIQKKNPYSYVREFQHEIPVLESRFKFHTNLKMAYAFVFQGAKKAKLVSLKNQYWKMHHIPPSKEEPFLPNIDDFKPKIIAQLAKYDNGRVVVETMNSWEKLTQDILQKGKLAKVLRQKNKELKVLAAKLTKDAGNVTEKMERIFNHVRDHMDWDGERALFTDRTLKEIYTSKKGSTAEINLLLTFLLQCAELDAKPVLLSTLSHGKIIKDYPLLSQFNTLCSSLSLEGKDYVLNASNPFRVYDMPAISDLNGEGWVLDNRNSNWIEIKPHVISKNQKRIQLKLAQNGILSGVMSMERTGYDALHWREEIHAKGKESFLKEEFEEKLIEGKISDYTIKNLYKPEASLDINLHIETADFTNVSGDFIYLNPFLMFKWEKNPFTDSDRLYPIDFIRSSYEAFSLSFELPANYSVESMPETAQISLPNKAMIFQYQPSIVGQILIINYRFIRNRTVYSQKEYPMIKSFYDEILSRHSEMIVLKKIIKDAEKD